MIFSNQVTWFDTQFYSKKNWLNQSLSLWSFLRDMEIVWFLSLTKKLLGLKNYLTESLMGFLTETQVGWVVGMILVINLY